MTTVRMVSHVLAIVMFLNDILNRVACSVGERIPSVHFSHRKPELNLRGNIGRFTGYNHPIMCILHVTTGSRAHILQVR